MIRTCSFAASALITLAIILGVSAPVAASRPAAAALHAAQPLPVAAGCCVLA